MKPRDIDVPWSELQLVLAVQREGTLRGAAKVLRLSHPTVSRRISELQEDLGVHLFEREGRSLRLTLAGEDLAQTAARIEQEIDGLSRRIAGQDHRLEGLVRVALSPSMLAAIAPALPTFIKKHPGIELELLTDLHFASLTRREADIAIRQTDSPHETLVGRRVSQFEQAIYVHRSLNAQFKACERNSPNDWPWIDWDEAHRHHSSAGWIKASVDPSQVVARCESSLAMYQLIKAQVGVGFAPTMLAAPDPELIRIDPIDAFPTFQRAIWVLTHADLKKMGRIKATTTWLAELLYVQGAGVWQGFDRVLRKDISRPNNEH